MKDGDQPDLRSLLDLAKDSSANGRKQLVTVISDLFLTKASDLSDRERGLMTGILSKLVGDFEIVVRRELAVRLADNPAVPRDLIVLLANDEIEVARPILFRSAVLRDDELIAIIHERTLEHQLAIAMRRRVSMRVSHALAETENADVIKALLANADAEISEGTMGYLVEQSQRVDGFQEPLVRREDLPSHLARRMYWWVSAALRAHIVEHFRIDPGGLDDQIEDIVEQLAGDASPGAAAPSTGALVRRMARERMITPELLVRTLRQGEVALFVILFAELAGLRPERIRKLLHDPVARDLAIACRAVGTERETFATIYLLRHEKAEGRVHDPRELVRALKFYDAIKTPDAEKILGLWQRNPYYQDAIEQVGPVE